MNRVELRSDNAAGVAPEIMEVLAAANTGSALAYGHDEWSARLTETVRAVFEHDTATVFPVTTGTAANSLGLAALCPPWGAVLCHETAHVHVEECGATSMYAGGAVIAGLDGPDFRLHPDGVAAVLDTTAWGDPHRSQPAVLSLTEPTDYGTVYQPEEIAALARIARRWGLRVHLDGARLASAVVALGCSPADVTWRAGVDVFTLGATKNGVMSTDAIVSFHDAATDELVYRTKRAGHVASKMRFQAAQLDAYLTDGLWLRLAGRANTAMAALSAGLADLGVEAVNRPDVNILFVRLSEAVIDRLAPLAFYRIEPGMIRLVTSFQTTEDDVERALRAVGDALG